MRQQTRSRIATGLDRMRLLKLAARSREGWLAARARGGPETGPDGLPLPPPRLRLLVSGGGSDAEEFLWVGAQAADAIRAAAGGSGTSLESMESILDFGCGCGRVARHWAQLEGPEIHGCDYNGELVAWCQENLPFMRAAHNELEPPTPYAEQGFDLIYALSVLSHLDEPLQQAWVSEYRRLLRPGGLLIVSVLGEADRVRLNVAQRERFDRGELVIERARMRGSNLCTAYHPRSYVTDRLLADFVDVRAFDLGSGERTLSQEAYIARRPG
jgi:SAM-dependent methyltransferase